MHEALYDSNQKDTVNMYFLNRKGEKIGGIRVPKTFLKND